MVQRVTETKTQTGAVAVLLNANAKQVNTRIHRALAKVVPAEDLFFSQSADEAEQIADLVVARGYRTVFTGGGDGTFVSWVNQILDRAESRGALPPRFGVLALGTGNALAEMVGAKKQAHLRDLVRFIQGENSSVRRLDLLTCDGRRTPFAGVGIDAAVLNDYNWLRERLSGTPFRGLSVGAPGYGLAVMLRSAPRLLMERRTVYCEIMNVGQQAWRLDGKGERVGAPVAQGELLYAGPCLMAAASTVPFYGMGLKLFPYALSQPGMMQLRVATRLTLGSVLAKLPSLWAGRFNHPGIQDFQVERVSFRCERPMPLQVGGDAHGWREETAFSMTERSVELVDFGKARVLAAA